MIYLDHAATTPLDPQVLRVMQPYLKNEFGNPSALYGLGRRALKAVAKARKTVADILDCVPNEIIFTGSGTESDNLAILGAARALKKNGNHIISTKIEHHAVLNPCAYLQEQEGFNVTYLDADKDGFVSPEQVLKAIRPETILVSIMYANNEIGTIEPIAEIGKAIQKYKKSKTLNLKSKILFHTDACQAAGALDLNVNRLHVDLMTINGGKIYGPKGVGALYKKRDVKIHPLIFGGGQEFNLRSGTENVAGIVGLAESLRLAQQSKEKENKRLIELRNYLWQRIQKIIPKVKLNGPVCDTPFSSLRAKRSHPFGRSPAGGQSLSLTLRRLPNNLNLSILDIEGEAILLYLDEKGIQASTGSACTSQSLNPSHVILALGLPYEFAHGSLRFTLGHATTKKDLDYVLKVLPPMVAKLREISPVRLSLAANKNKHPRYIK